ncbi:MAG: response regulator [Trichodesmium sp.]
MLQSNVITDRKTESDFNSNVTTLKSMPGNKQLIKLLKTVEILSQRGATGQLLLNMPAKEGKLYLFYGRLLYATSDIHRVRRWQRAIALHCNDWVPQTNQILSDPDKPWEYLLLYNGISKNQITIAQAKAVIDRVTLEILFCLSHYPDLTHQWHGNPGSRSELSLGLSLCYREMKPIFKKVAQMQNLSKQAGLETINPNIVPVPKKPVSPEALSGWGKYLQGDLTLWDIAVKLEKSVLAVTQTLLPLFKKELLESRIIPDLPEPNFQPSLVTVNSEKNTGHKKSKKKPLIACIDDSPVVAETLKKIIKPAGYNLISIQDPIKGLMEIAENKPDLIFLDLEMPRVNGYTVYQFLSKAPAFKEIPIIILTSRNNLIDRSRAKLMGAADFLTKPPEPETTLKVIQKYLSRT